MANYSNDMGSYSSDEVDTWISQFCSMFGHDYFVEVTPEFIEDDFNLTGLSSIVPYYKQALDVILDLEPETAVQPTDIPLVEHAAELLYGLIHARFILTKQGLHSMAEKYEENCFGSCPRYYCDGMHLIPIGRFDSPGIETVRLYCPNCNDIYLPSSSRYLNIDGAFFGTSFVGLFMKMFPEIDRQTKQRTRDQFQLKLFGFKLNESSPCGPRMKWLRCWPNSKNDISEFQKCEFGIPDMKTIQAINSNNDNNESRSGHDQSDNQMDEDNDDDDDDDDDGEEEEEEEEEKEEDDDDEEDDGDDDDDDDDDGADDDDDEDQGGKKQKQQKQHQQQDEDEDEDEEMVDGDASNTANNTNNKSNNKSNGLTNGSGDIEIDESSRKNQSAGESIMSIAKD
ncbi:CMP-N-acetylneuraminate-beta-galactosamide-alpha-2,3-sialyltransferase 2 [Pichia californica]|uniref:Casein kinase II subunit beta n=1 Tax=Pichia californica TaxID=460514 RepID=A0A9P6WL92_9ASCO|nr:CMP-N-acetylneuraminate-beta-galactosamide-alpha-2,3-sialyltransferase 2 [[Candida] californica]